MSHDSEVQGTATATATAVRQAPQIEARPRAPRDIEYPDRQLSRKFDNMRLLSSVILTSYNARLLVY